MIQQYAKSTGSARVNYEDLRHAFERKGERPHCLQQVLAIMEQAGEVKRISQFMEGSSRTWSSWLRSLPQAGFQSLRGSLFGTPKEENEDYILLDVVGVSEVRHLRSLGSPVIRFPCRPKLTQC